MKFLSETPSSNRVSRRILPKIFFTNIQSLCSKFDELCLAANVVSPIKENRISADTKNLLYDESIFRLSAFSRFNKSRDTSGIYLKATKHRSSHLKVHMQALTIVHQCCGMAFDVHCLQCTSLLSVTYISVKNRPRNLISWRTFMYVSEMLVYCTIALRNMFFYS